MSQFSEQQMQDLRNSFMMFDKNRDGCISSDELTTVLRSLGQNPTKEEVAQKIKALDPNGSGKIEFPEFMNAMAKWGMNSQEEEAEEIRAAFKILDRDRNGVITIQELRHVMCSMGERMTDEEVSAMIKEADRNGDGVVNYEEFSKIITRRQ